MTRDHLSAFFASFPLAPSPRLTLSPAPAAPPPPDRQTLQKFFHAIKGHIDRAEAERQEVDREHATRFNVVGLIDPDENELSDLIGLLLDPRGSHGQGDAFLRVLFEQLGVAPALTRTAEAVVRREVATYAIRRHRRRIDILVEAGVLLAIENKVDSDEQPGQVKDYLDHLARCTRGAGRPYMLVYLTPAGLVPGSLTPEERALARSADVFRCWSYQHEVTEWLRACRYVCRAPKIGFLLDDLIRYVQRTLRRDAPPNLIGRDDGR